MSFVNKTLAGLLILQAALAAVTWSGVGKTPEESDRLLLTEVSGEHDGDTFFPDFDRNSWQELSREPGQTPGLVFTELIRVGLSPTGAGE